MPSSRWRRRFIAMACALGAAGDMLPFARLPIPVNPAPEPIRYADLRTLFERWTSDLATAEATLAKVDSADVKLPLHFGMIRLDLNGDGKAEPGERLFNLYAQLNAAARNQVNAAGRQGFRHRLRPGRRGLASRLLPPLDGDERSLPGVRRTRALRSHGPLFLSQGAKHPFHSSRVAPMHRASSSRPKTSWTPLRSSISSVSPSRSPHA